ncbi:Thymocyte nuclear protein 1 [Actinomortierella wolfii]|nr:Thymocyte nuclear protein 1 [Actinomortierella wolfii]
MRRSTRLASKTVDHPPPQAAPSKKREARINDDISEESKYIVKRAKQSKKDVPTAEEQDTKADPAVAAEEPKATKGKAKKDPPASQLDDRKEGEIKIWLMKAEPDSRIVKGKDVKFSIDDLAAMPGGTSQWDGVVGERTQIQGPEVRNGIAEVVKEAYPDHSAFDPKHPYYDEKSNKDDPRWYMVDVKFKRKLKRFLSLKELQGYKDKELKNMQLLTRGRLSVQPVSQAELDFILDLEQRPAPENES